MSPLDTIRAAIQRRGWTAAELQRQSGISYRAAWAIINGSDRIAWVTLELVCASLGLRLVEDASS